MLGALLGVGGATKPSRPERHLYRASRHGYPAMPINACVSEYPVSPYVQSLFSRLSNLLRYTQLSKENDKPVPGICVLRRVIPHGLAPCGCGQLSQRGASDELRQALATPENAQAWACCWRRSLPSISLRVPWSWKRSNVMLRLHTRGTCAVFVCG
jgi:hypothetical protein